MKEQLEIQLMNIIRPLFPNEAEFHHRPLSDGLVFSIAWKLKNDPTRPNKRSRRIILIVSEETLEDYNDGNRDAIEKWITNFITENLRLFDPNHDTTYGQPEPEEQWILSPPT